MQILLSGAKCVRLANHCHLELVIVQFLWATVCLFLGALQKPNACTMTYICLTLVCLIYLLVYKSNKHLNRSSNFFTVLVCSKYLLFVHVLKLCPCFFIPDWKQRLLYGRRWKLHLVVLLLDFL